MQGISYESPNRSALTGDQWVRQDLNHQRSDLRIMAPFYKSDTYKKRWKDEATEERVNLSEH